MVALSRGSWASNENSGGISIENGIPSIENGVPSIENGVPSLENSAGLSAEHIGVVPVAPAVPVVPAAPAQPGVVIRAQSGGTFPVQPAVNVGAQPGLIRVQSGTRFRSQSGAPFQGQFENNIGGPFRDNFEPPLTDTFPMTFANGVRTGTFENRALGVFQNDPEFFRDSPQIKPVNRKFSKSFGNFVKKNGFTPFGK